MSSHPPRLRRRQCPQPAQRHPRPRLRTHRDRTPGGHPQGRAPDLPRRRRLRRGHGAAARAWATWSRCKEYLAAGRPFFGICIGLQTLFEGSEESPGRARARADPGADPALPTTPARSSVPHMGWNGVRRAASLAAVRGLQGREALLRPLLSRRARRGECATGCWRPPTTASPSSARCSAGGWRRCSSTRRRAGRRGSKLLRHFLAGEDAARGPGGAGAPRGPTRAGQAHHRLPGRAHQRRGRPGGDQGRSVRRARESGAVRNLGKPVELARRYYEEGADEITFLNITAFRDFPLADQPMLEVLRRTSEKVFVPLTIGGGIRAFTDAAGRAIRRLDVASRVFPLRCGQGLHRLGRGATPSRSIWRGAARTAAVPSSRSPGSTATRRW